MTSWVCTSWRQSDGTAVRDSAVEIREAIAAKLCDDYFGAGFEDYEEDADGAGEAGEG
jgi:hypothetical protein